MTRFAFAFDRGHRIAGLLFGVTPSTAYVDVADGELAVRFGPWRLRTPLTNITGVEESGGYAFLKTAGPAHLSLADRGVTFATNGRKGLCVTFAEPVRGIDPTGRIRHPGATITVADVPGLRDALR